MKSLIVMMLFFSFSPVLYPGFKEIDDDVRKEYIVDVLVNAIKSDSSIALVHPRVDEPFRRDGDMSITLERSLGLKRIRCLSFLKGQDLKREYGLIYIYLGAVSRSGVFSTATLSAAEYASFRREMLYVPEALVNDGQVRIVFLIKQNQVLKDRLLNYGRNRLLYEELSSMSIESIMIKFDLKSTYNDKVFSAVDKAVFLYETDTPVLPATDETILNKNLIEQMRKREPSKYFETMKLSREELTDIVCISYHYSRSSNKVNYLNKIESNEKYISYIEFDDISTELGVRIKEKLVGFNGLQKR